MKVYEYIDYIMSFFAKMNCKEGQGLFLLRTMDASVRRDGYTQETINILHKIVHILLCNDFISIKIGLACFRHYEFEVLRYRLG